MKPTKTGEKSTMDSAVKLDGLRSAAGFLLERERRRTGSKMLAYDSVASLVGASSSWLRKFVTGCREAKEPRWIVGQAILTQYARLCELVEAEQANERARNAARRIEIDAATGGALEVVAREMRGPAARKAVAGIEIGTAETAATEADGC